MLRASYSRAYIHKKSLKFLLESVTLHIRRKKVRLLFMQMRERTRIQTLEMSDGILAQRSIAGDQRAFEILVQRYSTPLFNFICRFLSDYDQACDILQQVFLQLYISLPKFRSVVLLRYAGQLSFSEIGQALDMPEATAKTYFQRAKPLLRAALTA